MRVDPELASGVWRSASGPDRPGERGRLHCAAFIALSLAWLVGSLLLVANARAAPPAEEPPELALELVPAVLEVPVTGETQVLLVVRNPTTETLRSLRLTWFTDADVSVTADAPEGDELGAYGTLTWSLHVAQAGQEPADGTLHLRLDYTWLHEGAPVPLLTTSTLELSARPPLTADQVARVQAQTSMESLMQFRPGWVYLVITNVIDVPISLTNVLTDGPDFVRFEISGPITGTLAPQETRTIPVYVTASDTVRPGKHLLLFNVGLRWDKGGRSQTGNVVVTHPIEAGVLGESEILTLLAVPSFLVLPGALIMITLGMLWRYVRPRAEFPFAATKSQEFWFLAVLTSLLIAFAYPVVTGWLHMPRNYLDGYGLRDVLYVWLGAIGLTGLAYSVVLGIMTLSRQVQAWRTGQVTPATGDRPIELLRKLGRQGLGVHLPRARLALDGDTETVFLLQAEDLAATDVWVGPAITLRWDRARLEETGRDLWRQVRTQLNPPGDPLALANLLERGQASGILVVDWQPTSRLRGPRRVARADLSTGLDEDTIVVEEE
jgi:predicted secreted protein